ncbi:uncharacterized protein LOC127008764 [Eriocheir sinensis]|uniref:uncharacterized protein LOC127008764 n=1 Tax=Eriocheir sinensis TaxID=95602 RepID=UPI0021C8BF12|nr:uncharacterized protein LOC127008764 [Eriocheir sinensis]
MPGPILRLAASPGDSNDFSVFESCDDIQEAWGGLNGNFSAESIYHECRTHLALQHCEIRVNGEQQTSAAPTSVRGKSPRQAMAEARPLNNNAARQRGAAEVPAVRTPPADEFGEAMEVEEELAEEAVETVNLPVVSASLSLDLGKSLTRQKISSVQRGPTLTYADHDDCEEPPTRRPRPLAHPNESMEVGAPLHCRPASPTSPGTPDSYGSPISYASPVSPGSPISAVSSAESCSPVSQRSSRVFRNPSYHHAVRDAAVSSPQNMGKPHQPDKSSRSCDNSPIRPSLKPLKEERPAKAGGGGRRHASESDDLMSVPLAANMPRSVSFSGQELASPAAGASGSLSEGNSRSGSVPHLSSAAATAAAAAHRSAPTLETKSSPPNFTRGSVISRSFRRLFSTPSRPPPAIQTEECWDDVPGVTSPSEADSSKSSRLKRISHSFSRKLSAKPKMSASGINGQHIVVPNGSTTPEDPGSLVEYEDLLKLFCCSGCQAFMAPPLHQCRKGHLVCSSCRFSLKQACPTCKQRFADSTNVMMEQVCQLVKFPCKYSPQGCPEFHRPRAKQDHEHFCSYRPVHCHHGPQGCPKVLLLRDMQQHLEICEYKKK